MDRSPHAEPSTSLAPPTPTYAFTVPAPRRQQRHKAAPGCPLCTILVNLEHEQTVPNLEEENLGRIEIHEQPLSPSLPSPAVVQKPLLPVNPTVTSIATTTDGRVLVLDDQDLTGWIASPDECLALDGRHVVIAFKRHIEDVYAFVRATLLPLCFNPSMSSIQLACTIQRRVALLLDTALTSSTDASSIFFPVHRHQGPADIPLLVHALQTAHALLDRTPSFSEHGGKGKAKETDENADQRHQRQSRSVENAGFDGCGEGLRKIGLFAGFTRTLWNPDSRVMIGKAEFPRSQVTRNSPIHTCTYTRRSDRTMLHRGTADQSFTAHGVPVGGISRTLLRRSGEFIWQSLRTDEGLTARTCAD